MKTHIYCVPGLAASIKIFDNIKLPKDTYEIHYIEWLIPESVNESLEHYAKRMCASITEKHFILLGVSFGGIVAQEMSKILSPSKLILISSVKTSKELPRRLKFTKLTKFYKLFPYKKIANNKGIVGFVFGKMSDKRRKRYKQFFSVRDDVYLEWAIYNVIHWNQKSPLKNSFHIHGTSDNVFPIRHIDNCIKIDNGTHAMIINKGKKISIVLIDILNDTITITE